MRYLKLVLTLAVLGAYPAVALAHKAPSKSQRAALVKAFGQNLKEAVPAKCLREEISTANASWAYVEFGFSHSGRLPAGCAKFAANGRAIFHFRAGRWRWVTSGSEFLNGNGGCSLTNKVPRNVITDLALC